MKKVKKFKDVIKKRLKDNLNYFQNNKKLQDLKKKEKKKIEEGLERPLLHRQMV